jgi:hypothetical protein
MSESPIMTTSLFVTCPFMHDPIPELLPESGGPEPESGDVPLDDPELLEVLCEPLLEPAESREEPSLEPPSPEPPLELLSLEPLEVPLPLPELSVAPLEAPLPLTELSVAPLEVPLPVLLSLAPLEGPLPPESLPTPLPVP